MGKYVEVEDIKRGFEFYVVKVKGNGEDPYLMKCVALCEPYYYYAKTLVVELKVFIDGVYSYRDYFSLIALNIINNNYNNYECFTCESMATRYLSYVRNGGTREGWHKVMESVTKFHRVDFGF